MAALQRGLVFVLVLLQLAFPRDAQAVSQAEAYGTCQAQVSAYAAAHPAFANMGSGTSCPSGSYTQCYMAVEGSSPWKWQSNSGSGCVQQSTPFTNDCASYNVASGGDATNGFKRNYIEGYSKDMCQSSTKCRLKYNYPLEALQVGTTGLKFQNAMFKYDGTVCTPVYAATYPESKETPSLPSPSTNPLDYCSNTTVNTKQCLTAAGQHCITSSKGNSYCYNMTETGTKTAPAQDEVVKRTLDGSVPPAPPFAPPAPDTSWTGTTQPLATTTNGSPSTIAVLVTSTYPCISAHNCDGTASSSGGSAGSPTSTSGTDPTSHSAGTSACDADPPCSGDPIMCAQLVQAHKTRCAAEKTSLAGVSGGDAECTHEYTITGGDAVSVQTLVEAQRLRCQQKAEGAVPNADADDGTDAEAGHVKSPTLGVSMLDPSGLFGAQSCPNLGVADLGDWGSFDFNDIPYFCDFTVLVSGILLLLGSWIAFRILAGA